MKARVRRTIKAFSGVRIAGRLLHGPRVAQPEIAGSENGRDLFDYLVGWILAASHANLHRGKPKRKVIGGWRNQLNLRDRCAHPPATCCEAFRHPQRCPLCGRPAVWSQTGSLLTAPTELYTRSGEILGGFEPESSLSGAQAISGASSECCQDSRLSGTDGRVPRCRRPAVWWSGLAFYATRPAWHIGAAGNRKEQSRPPKKNPDCSYAGEIGRPQGGNALALES